jgi:excinuclease ABC subunit C
LGLFSKPKKPFYRDSRPTKFRYTCSTMISHAVLKAKCKNLPDGPGVYLMKNLRKEIIYVGKAKSLKNRVTSYFVGEKDLKTKRMVEVLDDFDIMITPTEKEALLLERNLIKYHSPRYNIIFKDGKEYPYIRIQFKEEWPRIEKVRQRKDDGAVYVGPFSNAGYLRTALKLAQRIFPMIRCSRHEFNSAKRPCNYYHMKMCLAPCALDVNKELYLTALKSSLALIQGKNADVIRDLKESMKKASAEEQYETAAIYRDQIFALEGLKERQSVVSKSIHSADFFALRTIEDQSHIHLMMLRQGVLIGSENFVVSSRSENTGEILRSFLLQYYESRFAPEQVFLPIMIEDKGLIEEILNAQAESAKGCRILDSARGEASKLMDMAVHNLEYTIQEKQQRQDRQRSDLEALKKFLDHPGDLHHMECFDVSNLQGQNVVASCVCFMDGKPAKDQYRIFKIKGFSGQNDFAAIEEVIRRRLAHEPLPELIVIDGGKTQLSSAQKARDSIAELRKAPRMIALAKARQTTKKKVYERIFLSPESDPLILKPGSSEYRLLTHMRDEAHRFAVFHHRKSRKKQFLNSSLDNIPGLGAVLSLRLLGHFGGMDGLKKASFEELRSIKGVSEKLAAAIVAHFVESGRDEI